MRAAAETGSGCRARARKDERTQLAKKRGGVAFVRFLLRGSGGKGVRAGWLTVRRTDRHAESRRDDELHLALGLGFAGLVEMRRLPTLPEQPFRIIFPLLADTADGLLREYSQEQPAIG